MVLIVCPTYRPSLISHLLNSHNNNRQPNNPLRHTCNNIHNINNSWQPCCNSWKLCPYSNPNPHTECVRVNNFFPTSTTVINGSGRTTIKCFQRFRTISAQSIITGSPGHSMAQALLKCCPHPAWMWSSCDLIDKMHGRQSWGDGGGRGDASPPVFGVVFDVDV
jgi:hypothetical protein